MSLPTITPFVNPPDRAQEGSDFGTALTTWIGDLNTTISSMEAFAQAFQTIFTITANQTIYVSSSGNDDTGTGTSQAPYASVHKALASLADRRIAAGVMVTIQVSDGSYIITSTITVSHPDADKIQILGNTTAETTVAISTIDASAKTITVAGDYTSSIVAGDTVVIAGSTTSNLNGGYRISGVAYSGGNTVLTCSAETFASATVGGGSIIIKPCNRVGLVCAAGIKPFSITKPLYALGGFSFFGNFDAICLGYEFSKSTIYNIIIDGFSFGIDAYAGSILTVNSVVIRHSSTAAINAWIKSAINQWSTICLDSGAIGFSVSGNSNIFASTSQVIFRENGANCSPAANVVGNSGSCVYLY